MKGKNFSANNLGQRRKSDAYSTPYSLTRQFFHYIEESWDRSLPILEPACGEEEAIVKVLDELKFDTIHYYDIQDGADFLKEEKHYPYMVTNPPFSLAYEFVQKAKEVVDEQFALLLPLSYLHGKKRYDNIYQDREYPLSSVYVFTRYPMLGDPLREDGKYRTGMMVYAWFVWDKKGKGEPVIRWIDNSPYVLKRGD